MPKYIIDRIPCPECGRMQKVRLYPQLDVTFDRKLKASVLNHSLFLTKCSSCRTEISLEYNASYMDSSKGIHIALARDNDAYHRALEDLNPDLSQDFEDEESREVYRSFSRRIVRDSFTLAEKALILDSGMDDRIIEILKYVIWKMKENELSDAERLLFNIGFYSNGEKQLCFLPMENGEIQNKPIPFSETLYMQMEMEYEGIMSGYQNNNLEVDQDWAEDFLEYADPFIKKSEGQMNELELLIDQYYALDEEEDKAAFLKEHWESTFRSILDRWYETHTEKPSVEDLDETCCDGFLNWIGDIEIDLLNAKADRQLMDWCTEMLEELDYSDDPLEYHNLRRSYMEVLERDQGWPMAKEYLEQWKKEEPEDPYVIATEIDRCREHGELDEALSLAGKYLHMPLTDFYQIWLYDSIGNLYMDLGLTEKQKELEKLYKEAEKNIRY